MRLSRLFSQLLALTILLPACESLLEPEDDNHSTLDRVYEDPAYAEGLLIRAYAYIPTNDYRFDDVATDDAVTNVKSSNFLRMATGEWSSVYNPQNLWDDGNRAILYINNFLEYVEDVPWKWTNEELNDLYIRRLTGEAYALRGLFKYFLARNHGGIGSDGKLLGTPVYNEVVRTQEQFQTPRALFTDFLASAYADLDKSLEYLPLDYGNVAVLPEGFSDMELDNYNTVFGDYTQQRMSGRHAKAFKARLALLAASAAFNSDNNAGLWQTAANYTAELLNDIGGVSGLDPKGNQFYLKAQVDNADITGGDKKDIPEMLWRRPIYTNRTRETNNFPPSLYGSGQINPTQNLVDAFPMKNGFPITDALSLYDPSKPYANRDPRLALYIVYDGSKMKGATINTGAGGGDNAVDAVQKSTRTGYYLKKLLREDVNVNPNSTSDQKHFNTHIRYTELFLNYAEAANEAWGPDAGGTNAFTARQVIAAIRKRAGITQPDLYLASVTGKEGMRTLIRNERRLELCFEDFRFWDLRRWKADLTEAARGVYIDNGTYTYFTVEERAYDNSYMHYGPVPSQEVLKFNLVQNQGWN
ncbi:MAG: RagB/SusD family nutrient uptake outer membrane protein [Prolixibacteraceae bacterium]